MKISSLLLFAVISFIFINFETTYARQTHVGSVTQLVGEVKLKRNGKVTDAIINEDILLNDLIETGDDSFAKIAFKDQTSIEISSDSSLEVNSVL